MDFKCDIEKDGCDGVFRINFDLIKNDKYIQCPHCNRFIENPFYEGEGKTQSYIN